MKKSMEKGKGLTPIKTLQPPLSRNNVFPPHLFGFVGGVYGAYSPGTAGYDSSGTFRDASGSPSSVPSNFGANIGAGQPWAHGTPGYTPGSNPYSGYAGTPGYMGPTSPNSGSQYSYNYECANGACGGGWAPS